MCGIAAWNVSRQAKCEVKRSTKANAAHGRERRLVTEKEQGGCPK